MHVTELVHSFACCACQSGLQEAPVKECDLSMQLITAATVTIASKQDCLQSTPTPDVLQSTLTLESTLTPEMCRSCKLHKALELGEV